uniref:Kinase n=1 Tax=Steinernema glaseri TaxID=37863 RepID=A0A1I7Y7U6_9BILA
MRWRDSGTGPTTIPRPLGTCVAMVRNEPKIVESILSENQDPISLYDLKPFQHQVGGHVGMFSFGPNCICKPHESREASFYKAMPKELLPFTAKFYHHISVDNS